MPGEDRARDTADGCWTGGRLRERTFLLAVVVVILVAVAVAVIVVVVVVVFVVAEMRCLSKGV